ncbi:MAG: hypothetical protein K6E99_02120 [Bacilli bacterium]|nr:hypothetical protein [Bacilli bacterium]
MLNNEDITKIEYIDGVTVVYGKYQKNGNSKVDKYLYMNSIKFYDDFGNEFYANFESIDEAYNQMYYLMNRGVATVIGPKAPIKDLSSGEMIPNYNSDGVALYVVKKQKKELVKRKH